MHKAIRFCAALIAALTFSILFSSSQTAFAQAPTLGNYPPTMVAVGANTTVTPDAAPTGATSINGATNSNFKGVLIANPTTGVVRVTNAHPAGTYLVTVKAFNAGGMTSKTFTLTVVSGTLCTGTVQFTNAADVSVGNAPYSVAIGDFNNDGNQDIALPIQGTNAVSIRLGNGSGGFSGTTSVSVGSVPYSVAIGDFNNDGNQDFAAANRNGNTVSIRLGDGSGGFSGTTDVGVDAGPVSVAIGDFNNDGKQDFATANAFAIFPNTVSIRLGDGLGGFSGTTNVSVGASPSSVAIGDFNNDGNQDFASTNQGAATVSIRLGDGSGVFSGTTDVGVGAGPASVAIGDFNNDGKQDFASANQNVSTVSIRIGDGLGNFSGITDVSVDAGPVSVAIGDFNNDGKQDFATANTNVFPGTVSIRLGDGLGGFSGTTNVTVGVAPTSVAIGDFNNNGTQDFATANFGGSTASIRLGGCLVTTAAPASISGTIATSDGSPLAGVTINLSGAWSAKTITDSKGRYHFDNVDTDNFYTVLPALANYSFSPASRSFSLLGNKTDAVFTAAPDAVMRSNAIDTNEYFVRQQYLDFLGREPDQGGFEYWSNEIGKCGPDADCISRRRIDVAAAFFVEEEFQKTGSFIYRLYKASFGNAPRFNQFMPDRSKVVGGANLQAVRNAFVNEFVARAAFKQAYPDSMKAEQFVNKLFETAGLIPHTGEWESYVLRLNNGDTRARILADVIETSEFKQREYNPSFVLMEYFGYLRRDADLGGYNFWLNVLDNREPGNYRGMVCSFITSMEYQKRFSSVVTRSNAECGR
ncbi:MAG: FG-GAP-like repeat-containing protein [Pyrinomonadaceae bacterium]